MQECRIDGIGEESICLPNGSLITLHQVRHVPDLRLPKWPPLGFMLDDQAGIWFRTLNEDIVMNFEYIIKDILINFARRGNKWNPIDQLFAHKQDANKTLKDYICRTKSLPHQCNPSDKMKDDKLMSRFINGLFDPTHQNVLIARMCRSFAEACTIAMTFEYSMSGLWIPTHAPTNNHEKTPSI